MKKEKQDEKLYICRPCGYVLKESELRDVCPACGLPRKVFEHYKERMSPGRRRFLQLDMHPIAVHFPQSMLVLSMMALIINLVKPEFHAEVLLGAARYAAVIFPFAVFVAFISGLLDGLVRFKSVATPVLKKKIVYGIIMLAASVFSPILVWNGIDDLRTKLLLLLTGGIALICAIVLGHAGKKLMNIGMGGAMRIWGWKL